MDFLRESIRPCLWMQTHTPQTSSHCLGACYIEVYSRCRQNATNMWDVLPVTVNWNLACNYTDYLRAQLNQSVISELWSAIIVSANAKIQLKPGANILLATVLQKMTNKSWTFSNMKYIYFKYIYFKYIYDSWAILA